MLFVFCYMVSESLLLATLAALGLLLLGSGSGGGLGHLLGRGLLGLLAHFDVLPTSRVDGIGG